MHACIIQVFLRYFQDLYFQSDKFCSHKNHAQHLQELPSQHSFFHFRAAVFHPLHY